MEMTAEMSPQIKNAKFFCGRCREKYLFIIYKTDEEISKKDFPSTITVNNKSYAFPHTYHISKEMDGQYRDTKCYITIYFLESIDSKSMAHRIAIKDLEAFFYNHSDLDLFS